MKKPTISDETLRNQTTNFVQFVSRNCNTTFVVAKSEFLNPVVHIIEAEFCTLNGLRVPSINSKAIGYNLLGEEVPLHILSDFGRLGSIKRAVSSSFNVDYLKSERKK